MNEEFVFIVVEDVSPAPDDPKSDVSYFETEEEADTYAENAAASNNARVFVDASLLRE